MTERFNDKSGSPNIAKARHPIGAQKANAPAERMRRQFETPFGRGLYSRRTGTVEPVFAKIQNKGMRRFTLRGQRKVSAQWKHFARVHNIEKLAGMGR